jgi:hypothetical protein
LFATLFLLGCRYSAIFSFTKGTEKNSSSLIACVKPVDSLHEHGSRSGCASASVEGESLAADGRYRRGRKRSVLFCGLGFPRPGKHNPHAPSGGNDCGRAAATIARPAVASGLASMFEKGAAIVGLRAVPNAFFS